MIPRFVQQNVIKSLTEWRKIVLILGPRQSGKTTLITAIRSVLEESGDKARYFNCDIEEDRAAINTTAITRLSGAASGVRYLFVDEAQRMDNPGLNFKILYDHFPHLRIIATGSSSFDLKNSVSDAMTGRYVDFMLYPLSLSEIEAYEKPVDGRLLTSQLLLYGSYPEVYTLKEPQLKRKLLEKITESYLFKDILAFSRVRNSEAIRNLARALAYQTGSEINENELASRIKIDRKTLLSYLDILEKGFVIYRLYPYSKNPRREIGRRYKIFFVDVGIVNALIGDFNPLEMRADRGRLWENFLIIERIKRNAVAETAARSYFWRNYNGSEVDYIEVDGSAIAAWEIKDNAKTAMSRGAKVFTKTYGPSVRMVNRDNYSTDFLTLLPPSSRS